jgi:hypothetical protein
MIVHMTSTDLVDNGHYNVGRHSHETASRSGDSRDAIFEIAVFDRPYRLLPIYGTVSRSLDHFGLENASEDGHSKLLTGWSCGICTYESACREFSFTELAILDVNLSFHSVADSNTTSAPTNLFESAIPYIHIARELNRTNTRAMH